MTSDPRLPDEPRSWPLAVLEERIIQIMTESYGNSLELVHAIRARGATPIPRFPPEIGGISDFSIPEPDEGFWLIQPKDQVEEQCIEFLVRVWQVRDAIQSGNAWDATALTWLARREMVLFEAEALHGKLVRMPKGRRDDIVMTQIQEWLRENPKLRNTQIARMLQDDPRYAPIIDNIRDLRLWVGRLRKKNSI